MEASVVVAVEWMTVSIRDTQRAMFQAGLKCR